MQQADPIPLPSSVDPAPTQGYDTSSRPSSELSNAHSQSADRGSLGADLSNKFTAPAAGRSPIQPHPNATADETSFTKSGSQDNASQSAPVHQAGEGYSGQNKVPTIAAYQEDQAAHRDDRQQKLHDAERDQPERRESLPTTSGTVRSDRPGKKGHTKTAGEQEKEEMMKRMAPPKGSKPNHFDAEGERTVTDPVTRKPVVVADAEFMHDEETLKKFGVGAQQPPSRRAADEERSTKHVNPKPSAPGNILIRPFPEPVKGASLAIAQRTLSQLSWAIPALFGVIWLFTAFGHGFWKLLFRTSLVLGASAASYTLIHLTKQNIAHDLERVRMEMHRQRGKDFETAPESVEWLNALLEIFWKMVNPEMFVSTVDMVEDVMQASLPKFVDAVKISDYSQGSNPIRIIAMRGLADRTTDDDYPKEEWIDQGKPQAKAVESDAKKRDDLSKSKEEQDLDESGDYVNWEVSLAYQARPGQNLRQSNIHLLLEFFLIPWDLFKLPVPIWAQVEGFAATARIRMQMIESFPYVRNLTFTLMGVPKVNVSVQPMVKHFPNVLDLPIISGFVQSSIAAAAAEYVAPKSMTLNLAAMLAGGGIKKDTKALGVLAITIHHASNLSAQDKSGKSDPYAVLAYAKFGKPLYSTRIILGDLNPVWEETAFLLLTDDEVKAGEDLAVMLWDSDKHTADDLVGRITVPVVDLMLKPNQVHERTDNLRGFEDADEMKGTLSWSVAFYDKAPFNPKLKRPVNNDLPPEIRNRPELQEQNTTGADTTAEADALSIPPDPNYPAGILSIIVHQINSLERQNLKGATGDREGVAGQDTDAPEQEGPNLPSSYCELVLNDELIYATRVKQYTSMPFFEAGTERFIRDWRTAVVRVVVRDARVREHDPILGVVTLKLTDILSNSSQVTRLYSLQDGVGFGRCNISLLFRSVEAKIPRNYLGWSTATLEILSDIRFTPAQQDGESLSSKKLKLYTTADGYTLKSKVATTHDDGSVNWDLDEMIRLPVYDRYASSLTFELGSSGLPLVAGGPDAIAVLWLQDLVDDEEEELRIPLITGKDLKNLRQQVLNDTTAKTHEYNVIGHLSCKVKLDAGLDPDHEKYAKSQSFRHQFETYQAAEGLAEMAEKNAHADDDGHIDKQEQKAIDEAHKKQLKQRHRGAHQLAPVRTMVWAKDGIKERGRKVKSLLTGDKERSKAVESEA